LRSKVTDNKLTYENVTVAENKQSSLFHCLSVSDEVLINECSWGDNASEYWTLRRILVVIVMSHVKIELKPKASVYITTSSINSNNNDEQSLLSPTADYRGYK
jgi:hypothetical protein